MRTLTRRSEALAYEDEQHERLEEIGTRMAQVAHEVRVPVSLILGSMQTLEQYTAASLSYIRATADPATSAERLRGLRRELNLDQLSEHVAALLDICREGTRRLDHVVQQLRGFAAQRINIDGGAPADVCNIIEEATALALAAGGESPTIYRDLPKLPPVFGVAESLSQAFGNVVGNAIEACVAVDNPQIWLSATARRPLGATTAPQGFVEVRIRDNGPGIPAEQQARIFEPFFSTKVRRSGMGLGLAISKQIIVAHHGTIDLLESSPSGTTFVIQLPLASVAAAS